METTVIQVENIEFSYATHKIIHPVSFSIAQGEMIGLIGPNGAGKSTLLKMLANILPCHGGEYLLDGESIKHIPGKTLAKTLGYLGQNTSAHWPLTVRKVIELGRLPHQGFSNRLHENDQLAIDSAVAVTEVGALLDRIITQLSGGEQARVLLARLLTTAPKVIFLDEPIAALDPYHQLHVMEILQQLTRQGCTVVIVMHDLNLASRFCNRLLLLDKGKLLADGSLADLLQNQLLETTYGIHLKMFHDDDTCALTAWSRRNRTEDF